MYTRWLPKHANPEIIEEEDLEHINNGNYDRYNGRDEMLFARKFTDSSGNVIEKINDSFLNI